MICVILCIYVPSTTAHPRIIKVVTKKVIRMRIPKYYNIPNAMLTSINKNTKCP